MAWLTGWTYRKKITTQFANVDAALTDFPLYVGFSNDTDLASALATGFDIRFTQSDGETLLKYERESWSGGGGSNVTADFWVKVPSISAVAGTDIYVYWGNAGAADGQDAANTWRSEYKAVWHLGDLTDSSGNGNTLSNPFSLTPVTGKVGNCYEFNGSTEYLSLASAPVTTEPFTISAIIEPDSASNHGGVVGIRGSSSLHDHSLSARGDQTGDQIWAECTDAGPGYSRAQSTTGYSVNTWHHVVASFMADNSKAAYIDGGSKGTDATSETITGLNQTTIGRRLRYGASTKYFDGKIDEIRLYDGTLSDAWIKFERANIFEADHELTWGSVEEEAAGRKAPILGGGVALGV